MRRFIYFGFFSFVFIGCAGQLLAQATSGTWTQTAAGGTYDWNNGANWSSNPQFPDANDGIATFGSISADQTIRLVPPPGPLQITIGTITVSSSNAYTFADAGAGNVLIFSVSTGSANLTISSGSHTYSYSTYLDSNLTITQNSGSPLQLTAVIQQDPMIPASPAFGVTFAGSGTTIVTGANSYTGGTTVQSGILNIANDANLNNGPVTIQGGTLQFANAITPSNLAITLSGSATIDPQAFAVSFSNVISGSGSLTKVGSGTLTLLNGTNSYSGGTSINAGTLIIGSDANLGNASGPVNINNGATLQMIASTARTMTLTGSATIDPQGSTVTFSGPIGGSGSLTKISGGTLILTGANTFTGGIINSAGTLQGNTGSLPGNISNSGTLVFNQTSAGTYSGVLSGAGAMTLEGGSSLTLSADNSGYAGTVGINNGQLIVNGKLNGTTITVGAAGVLSGIGIVSSSGIPGTSVYGQLIPGASGSGTLTIGGNLTFQNGSVMTSQISPGASGLVTVSGQATLSNSTLQVSPTPGFYGLSASYVLLTSGGIAGTFQNLVITDPNFTGTVTYDTLSPTKSVLLTVQVLRPFAYFPFANSNEAAVGNNLDELNASGALASDPDLVNIINSFAGQSNAVINDALDQMHPAIFSALAELQAELGGQILSLFHRKPTLICGCCPQQWRVWAEPFGNWLDEKNQGQQVGFYATTGGVAIGMDTEVLEDWVIGLGAAWNDTGLDWDKKRGNAHINGLLGSFYTDYKSDRFYVGLSCFGGQDWYETHRHISFTTIDRHANAHFGGFDLGGQLTAAYFFGSPVCLLYPYGTVDYLYLKTGSLSENGAMSLDLNVSDYHSSTLRSEAGFALQFIDKNYRETICISPLLAFGWAMEWPLDRSDYSATFANQTLPFQVKGWDETWQLLNLKFGIAITYRCFRLNGEYIADISPEGNSPFFNSRGNLNFEYSW